MPMVLPVPILPELGHSCSCRNRTITGFHIEGNSSLSLTNLANKCFFCCCFYAMCMHAIGVPRSVMFCPCESDVVNLIKLNYCQQLQYGHPQPFHSPCWTGWRLCFSSVKWHYMTLLTVRKQQVVVCMVH